MAGTLIKFAILVALGGSMQAGISKGVTDNGSTSGTARFPQITSKDLAGRSIALPAGFPGEKTLLLIAFTREQQHHIDAWVGGLHLEDGKTAWLEVPVIDNPGAIGRWFIDNGMRRGIPNHDTWRHVVTLYTKKSEFMMTAGLANEATVYAMVVDRQGRIVVSVPGPFTPDGAEKIQAALI